VSKEALAKQVVFISSAGMYQSSGSMPILETDSVKSSNGARKVELFVQQSGLKYTFLRPQYLYGEKASKRYLDYFIGRIGRNLPVPVPLSGDQLVCLTNLADLADLISTSLGHPSAVNEVFNAGSDRYVTYKGLCAAIAAAYGAESKVLSYDPAKFENWDGKLDVSEFPFRYYDVWYRMSLVIFSIIIGVCANISRRWE
jgi:nucleoside-diphosphate-sugar epimerase